MSGSFDDSCPADRPGRVNRGHGRDRETPRTALSRRHRYHIKRRLIAAIGLVVGLGALGLPSLSRTLRVGVSGSAPFVIEDAFGEGLSGISVEVWRRVA